MTKMLGEVWMAFADVDEDRIMALPEYAAVSAREVGIKILDDLAAKTGYKGLLAQRLAERGWTIRQVSLVKE